MKDDPKVSYVFDPSGEKTGDFLIKDKDHVTIVQIPKDEVTLKVIIDSVYKIGYMRGMAAVFTTVLPVLGDVKSTLKDYDAYLDKVCNLNLT